MKKCLERYCELANEKNEQLNKVSTPCLDDHHFKKEELEMARIGLWYVNKIARAVTKLTRACHKRLITDNIVMWVIRRSIVDWASSKTQTSLQVRGEFCVSSEVEHSFLKVGCVRKKLQSLTFQPNLMLFLWLLVFAWTVSLHSISWTWFLKYSFLLITFEHGETRCETISKANTPTPRPRPRQRQRRRNTATEIILNYSTWITLSQT